MLDQSHLDDPNSPQNLRKKNDSELTQLLFHLRGRSNGILPVDFLLDLWVLMIMATQPTPQHSPENIGGWAISCCEVCVSVKIGGGIVIFFGSAAPQHPTLDILESSWGERWFWDMIFGGSNSYLHKEINSISASCKIWFSFNFGPFPNPLILLLARDI